MPETQLPAGPRESSFAQLRRMIDDPLGQIRDYRREFGSVFTMRVLGQAPWVIAGDPALVRTVFKSTADEMHSDADAMKYLLGRHTVLFLDGEAHRRERRVLNQPFRHERMVAYAERMLARTDDGIARLRVGDEVVFLDFIQKISLAVIAECMFGVEAPERRDRLSALFARHLTSMQTGTMGALAMALGGERFRDILRAGTDLRRKKARIEGPLPDSRSDLVRFFDTKAEMDAMLRDELARCRAAGEGRDDLLALLANTPYDDGTRMSDDVLLDELFALLLGGHETSAITLAWAIHFLLREPECLAKLRAEIDSVFGAGPVTARGIERMPYLHAVIDEALRIRPVAANIPRKLTAPMEIEGRVVPAGTRVFPSPAILHFREDLWEEPESFRPERFLGARPSPFHFLPFGGGSRACLGRPFAQVEMRLLLAEIVQRVDFESSPRAATRATLRGILTGPSDGVPVVVRAVRPRPVHDCGDEAGSRSIAG